MGNYTPYHVHTELSLLDSCTKYKAYIDKAVELGMKAICITEHGNIYNHVEKKMYCDEKGIKFLFGVECYLTKTLESKIRDNYHTILIAKNDMGKSEICQLIDLSTQPSHMYYKNRITFDEFLNISDNVIKISACIMSPLNKLSDDDCFYERLAMHYDYYEIQYHNDIKKEQSIYNNRLYELSQKYKKPLIAGTDTHSINNYKAECRKILKTAKNMSYDDEDSYDLTFKSYDELVGMFEVQNSLPMNVVLEAIENTNTMADSCDDYKIDASIKYPKLTDNDEEVFVGRIYEKAKYKLEHNIITKDIRYLEQIQEEIRVFKKLNMCSFMLFMSEMLSWCKENNIPTCPCRGSVGGSMVAFILDITEVDPIKWGTVFSRFANEDRKEVGDIDCDFAPMQQEIVQKYIMDRFGLDYACYILSLGTISDKGTIDDIGRALGYSINKVKDIKDLYAKDIELAREQYKDLFYYFDGLLGTTVSQGFHPAGVVASPVTLTDNYGTFWNGNNKIMQINMEEVHECGLVKYDILGLRNIGIIKDTCEMANIDYPQAHILNWDDKEVWDSLLESPIGLFQFGSDFAFDCLSRFNPSSINDTAMVSAITRPGAASIRDRFLNHESNINPDPMIDELFKDNNGWLIFQEDTLAFLQSICGLKGSEADNVRRAIGRKQFDRLESAMPRILEGYCSKSSKTRDIAELEAQEFLQILSDSAQYQFGKNHSTGYSMITYMCAYLRHYYPYEFICAYLNNSEKKEHIQEGTTLATLYNIKINPPKFRYSKATYFPDKENQAIYKGLSSIKYMNETVADELYELRNNRYDNFLQLLKDVSATSINSRQLSILITVGFFNEFGKSQTLLDIVDIYNTLNDKKQFKFDSLPLNLTKEDVEPYAAKTTAKMFTQVDTDALIEYLINRLEDRELPASIIMMCELENIGYISYTEPTFNPRVCVVTEVKINNYGTPFITLYRLCDGNSTTIKVDKKYYNSKPLEQFSIVLLGDIEEKAKRKKINGEWTVTGEKELILQSYSYVKE